MFARPGRALVVALFVVAVTAVVVVGYPSWRVGLAAWPAAVVSVVDLLVVSAPLVLGGLWAWRAGEVRGRMPGARGIRLLLDLATGASVGLIVRGLVEAVAPTQGSLGGPLGGPSWAVLVVLVVGIVVVTPVVEEWFFRGVLLRALVGVLEREGSGAGSGAVLTGGVAVLGSAVVFAGLHVLPVLPAVPVGLVVGSLVLGIGCGILTLVTGRLGAAIAAHVAFNAVGVGLLLW